MFLPFQSDYRLEIRYDMVRNEGSNKAVDAKVGSRLRVRRKALDLTQMALADAVGITFQQIQKYEKGTNRISASRIQQFAEVLSVPPSFFFDGQIASGPNDPMEPLMKCLQTTDGSQLASAFSKITDKELRRRIVRLVEELTRP